MVPTVFFDVFWPVPRETLPLAFDWLLLCEWMFQHINDYLLLLRSITSNFLICFSKTINWFSSLLFYSCRLGQVNFQFYSPSLLNCLVIYTRYLWITVSWFDRIWIWRFMFLFLFCLHTFLTISWFVIEQATIKPFFD